MPIVAALGKALYVMNIPLSDAYIYRVTVSLVKLFM